MQPHSFNESITNIYSPLKHKAYYYYKYEKLIPKEKSTLEIDSTTMNIINVNTLTIKESLSQIGGLISSSLIAYGLLTSLILPILFYQNLS